MERCIFELVHDTRSPVKASEVANSTPAINRALHRQGVTEARADRIRINEAGRLLGTTTLPTITQSLLEHRNIVLRAVTARAVIARHSAVPRCVKERSMA